MWRLEDYTAIADEIVRCALARGAEFVEVFVESTGEERLTLDAGRVSHSVSGSENGASLRLVKDGHTVFGAVHRFDLRSGMRLLQELFQTARACPEIRLGLRPARVAGRQPSFGPPPFELALSSDMLAALEKGGQAYSALVYQVNASVRRIVRAVLTVNSCGTRVASTVERTTVNCTALARSGGRVQVGIHTPGAAMAPAAFFAQDPPEAIGAEAARIAVAMLDSRPAPTGVMPVVIDSGRGGTVIHEACVHPLEADLVLKGKSVFHDRLGQAIASPLVTVCDDATIKGALGSYPYDDEGTPARSTILVEAGRLVSFLTDLDTSKALGLPLTGNSRRQSFAYAPFPRMSNTFIAAGQSDPAEILAETPRGVFARHVSGGEVNEVTGQFVFTVSEGYLIENGRLTSPLHRVTLVGSGPDVLRDIDRVGHDLKLAAAACARGGQTALVTVGQPTIRVRSMVVGGTVLS